MASEANSIVHGVTHGFLQHCFPFGEPTDGTPQFGTVLGAQNGIRQ